MARQPRLCIPGQPHLVVQTFRAPLPISVLKQAESSIGSIVLAEGLIVHAWSLSPERAAFLLTPSESRHLSYLIRSLMRRLVLAGHMAGSLDRYRSCALSADWVLHAQHWIERLALGSMTSSEAGHTGESAPEPWVRSHPRYWALGNTPFERQELWRARLQEPLSERVLVQIEQALRGQWWLGDLSELEALGPAVLHAIDGRRLQPGPRGRPRSKSVPN